jgi:2-C-methyl-D-erythritol 4-phosphate cytidylyltransferase
MRSGRLWFAMTARRPPKGGTPNQLHHAKFLPPGTRGGRITEMNIAIIVAAGIGKRMGPNRDKLFLEAAGQPVIAHTWRQFETARRIDEIILVVRDGLQDDFTALARKCGFDKPFQIVAGGAERQDSVWNGLQAAPAATQLAAIHDGARPCVTHALIHATLDAAAEIGAAVAACKVTDTIKEAGEHALVARTVDRTHLWAVQTPQTFRREVIGRAITAARERGLILTDDTAACELIGQPVKLVDSPAPNPKVTVPADLPYVELLLRNRLDNQDAKPRR